MKQLSNDEVLDAQQALAEHTEAVKPRHTDTSNTSDFMATPSRWNAPQLNITDARAAAHERIRKANATKQNQ
jgi:hypothetical protein